MLTKSASLVLNINFYSSQIVGYILNGIFGIGANVFAPLGATDLIWNTIIVGVFVQLLDHQQKSCESLERGCSLCCLKPPVSRDSQLTAKMPLESHSAEAKRLLAAFLNSVLTRPQHWYSPTLPEDHPSSLIICAVWHVKSWILSCRRSAPWRSGDQRGSCDSNTRGLSSIAQLSPTEAHMHHWHPRNNMYYLIGEPDTSGKEKKMSAREKLKGGATVKQEAE